MANQNAPFGLKPIGKVGQNADNQGLSEYSIAASATAIYQNDPVKMASTGTIAVAGAGGAILGSLNGVFYTDTTNKPRWANHLATGNAATDIVGFVSDDPYERFEIQCNSTAAQADVFLNGDITYLAGDSANYVSKVMLNKATVTADADVTLRILGISKDIANSDQTAANVNLVVSINEHDLAKGTAGI
jgi:hypothetical protein